MDEVFLLGSEKSPSTKSQDPAKVFAKAVNQDVGCAIIAHRDHKLSQIAIRHFR